MMQRDPWYVFVVGLFCTSQAYLLLSNLPWLNVAMAAAYIALALLAALALLVMAVQS